MDQNQETVELFRAFRKEELQQRVTQQGLGYCYCCTDSIEN